MAANKLLICDLDGTLVDSRADLTRTVNNVRAHYALSPLDIDTVTGYIGNGSRALIERSMAGTDIDTDEAFALMKNAYSSNILTETVVYPTVEESLKRLKAAGWKIALATNKPQHATDQLLAILEMNTVFDVALGDSGHYPRKPEPDMLNLAIESTGAAKDKTWIIGDHHTDLEAGRRAGIKRCHAAYGFGNPEPELPDLSVSSFAQLADFILA